MSTKGFSRFLLIVCFSALTLFTIMLDRSVSAADLHQFNSPLPNPPANDNFAQATEITSVPFSSRVATFMATVEPNEPNSRCNYDPISNTVWYKYTPTTDEALLLRTDGNVPLLTIYTGTALNNLNEQACYWYQYETGVIVSAGSTYYFQLASQYNNGFSAFFSLEQAPPPTVDFYFRPDPPAKGVDIYFNSYSDDPVNEEIQSWFWDFGDGTTSTEPNPSHRYSSDGDYLVSHTITTISGRTASIENTVSVSTHDVGIQRFSRPRNARVGQTKRLIIRIANFGYPEEVNVELYKSVPGGFEYIGFLRQFVDVKRKGGTTPFYLSYTFTQQDADIGKVVFKAEAVLNNHSDAFPADNEFITYAVNVKPKWQSNGMATGEAADDLVLSAALDDYSDYGTDTISNVNAMLEELGTGTVAGVVEDEGEAINEIFKSYLPSILMQ